MDLEISLGLLNASKIMDKARANRARYFVECEICEARIDLRVAGWHDTDTGTLCVECAKGLDYNPALDG